MTGEMRHRFAVVAGAGAFVLGLLGFLVAMTPAAALLGALAVGVGVGVAVSLAAAVSGPGRAAPTGRRVDRMAGEPVAVPPGPEHPTAAPAPALPDGLAPPPFVPGGGAPTGPSPDDTAQLTPSDLLGATDLHQTIRLDAEHLQYVLPEVSAEEILREREGIDEAFLKAGAGIEEPATPSENVSGGGPG